MKTSIITPTAFLILLPVLFYLSLFYSFLLTPSSSLFLTPKTFSLKKILFLTDSSCQNENKNSSKEEAPLNYKKNANKKNTENWGDSILFKWNGKMEYKFFKIKRGEIKIVSREISLEPLLAGSFFIFYQTLTQNY